MTFQNVCDRLREVHRIVDMNTHSVVSANAGCAFVVDRENPHLGGNLEGGDLGTRYGTCVWPWVIKKFKPKNLLDVGCADGFAVRWFADNGVDAHGLDGLPYNIAYARDQGTKNAFVHDLTTGPYVHEKFDVIWCCDVVEHIAEDYLDNVMATFQQAKMVLLTNGTELHGSDGWHHITNLPDTFWIEWMKNGGFQLDESLTAESRAICHDGWYKHLGKVFMSSHFL
jgi:SAM-dependent methyltransferase